MTGNQPTDLAAILAQRAIESPDQVAFRYIGRTPGPTEMTYANLHRVAGSIGSYVKSGIAAGDRVLLLFPPGLEFIQAFMGCMYAGAVVVPAPAPNILKPKRSLERLLSIVNSARPTWAMTTHEVMEALRPVLGEVAGLEGIRWLTTEEVPRLASPPSPVALDPSRIALIQYTSGSTSEPKGAALSHRNVMANAATIDVGWEHSSQSIVLNWLPAFHDLGLVYGILLPIWKGFLSVQMSPIDVIQRPYLWLQAMSSVRATHGGGPNFIYELCARKVTDAELVNLDLSAWKVALTAAEPIRVETLNRFLKRFASTGFQWRSFAPGYGLSECTCKVSALPAREETTVLSLKADRLEQHVVEVAEPGPGTRNVVGCGYPVPDTAIEIVDPETCRALPGNRVGEIWVSGSSVAEEYWGRPDATAASLKARIVAGDERTFLRTGDLGFLHGGQIFVTGRIKDMILVRGTNHYPQDIESTVQDAHPCIRAGCTAAFAYEEEDEERVAVVAEVERRAGKPAPADQERRLQDPSPRLPPAPTRFVPDQVVAAITKAVAENHGIRVHKVVLIKAGTIPKTTSGKIQRNASRRAFLSGRLELVASEGDNTPDAEPSYKDVLRDKLLRTVAEVGGVARERVRPDVSLYDLGIDSIAGVNIAYEVSVLVGRDIPASIISEHDSVDKLVDYVINLGRPA